jgi:hypothetical protein
MAAKDQQRQQQQAAGNYNAAMGGHLNAYQAKMDANEAAYRAGSQQYLNTPSGVSNWLNPMMDYQREQVNAANNQQYAANGTMNSGAAMKALQDRQQNLAKLSFNDAFNMMNQSNNQGLGYTGNLANMRNDSAGNIFNAQAGMANNQLNAAMGQRQAGIGDFLTGFGNGANAFGNVMNAFRSSPGTGQPAQVATGG